MPTQPRRFGEFSVRGCNKLGKRSIRLTRAKIAVKLFGFSTFFFLFRVSEKGNVQLIA